MPSDMLGLSSDTMNKHFTWVSALLKTAKSIGHVPLAKLDFEQLRQKSQSAAARKSKGRARDRRASWSLEQIARLLSAPIWTGSRAIDLRFEAGNVIYHDAWYWLPLFNVLYGGRSSETAGLELSEIYEDAPIPYFSVEDTELRKLKNSQSIRKLPIHPELIRLGFLDYVREIRRLRHTFLFPEMYSPKSKSFAKTYYTSIFAKWRAWAYPDGTPWKHQVRGMVKDCDVHSFRGAVSTALKGVPDGIRYDILGYEGNNATTIFYDGETDLDTMRDALVKLTPLTAHIEYRQLSMRPVDRQLHRSALKGALSVSVGHLT
jgi:integrase